MNFSKISPFDTVVYFYSYFLACPCHTDCLSGCHRCENPVCFLDSKLQLTRTSPSELVWNDKGGGSKKDGSFWTVPRNQLTNGWKMLGETCCEQSNSVNTPCSSTILVKENSGENILKQPVSVTQIWNDHGSHAKKDVAIYRLNPPSGYKCLGMVAVASHSTQPDLSKYRCVKNEYVHEVGLARVIWDDHGSHSKKDFTAYEYETTQDTVAMGTFYGANNYDYDEHLKFTIVHSIAKDKSYQ